MLAQPHSAGSPRVFKGNQNKGSGNVSDNKEQNLYRIRVVQNVFFVFVVFVGLMVVVTSQREESR